MIVHYIYNTDNGSKQLVGCVVRTDEGRFGYSAIHPKDRRKMSRKLARTIAIGRAEKCDIYLAGGRLLKSRHDRPVDEYIVPSVIIPHLADVGAV